ncbi:MAG: carboxypeptidase M32 [Verrucomicrobiota bacterium]
MESSTKPEAYEKLLERLGQVALIHSSTSALSWDQETYMPEKAVGYRAQQIAYLSGQAHRLCTESEVGHWISTCEDHGFAEDSTEGVNVREWRRSYDRATKLPTSLVEEMSQTTALARNAWITARQKSDYASFKPMLQKIIDLNLQSAEHWGYEVSPYDALLDEYEPGARAAELSALFETLGPAQSKLVAELTELSQDIPADLLHDDYPIEKQQAFNRTVAEAFGFDFEAGRIDTTTHPFCTHLGPQDCRLTTRYDERDFTSSLYGILHEAGHGLYEQGLLEEHFGTPCGDSISLGIHESQSRLWENKVGRARAFWEHWYPTACEYFPNLKAFTPAQLTAVANRVSPSHIRVEADAVTYDLHIILRFRAELELIEGRLTVDDLPAFWNEHFEKLLGLNVPDDAHGCLQDIHWSLGSFGYFPTYSLGNLNAAQLFATARKDVPTLEKALAQGDYQPLLTWLRSNVHQPGKRRSAHDLIKHVTGSAVDSQQHLADLEATKQELKH